MDIDFDRLKELVKLGEEWDELLGQLSDQTHYIDTERVKELVIYAIYIDTLLSDFGLSASRIESLSIADYSDLKRAIREVIGG